MTGIVLLIALKQLVTQSAICRQKILVCLWKNK